MGQAQKKEVSQGMTAEKVGLLAETEQTSENALPSGLAEKSYEETARPIKNKQFGKKKLGCLAAVAVVLAVLALGLGIYNTPGNRLARQLDLGERYLEEQNYAEAVLTFEKAIQIDERCMAAYVNGIEAYRHLDEPENLLAFYEKALGTARSLEREDLTADMDAVVSIYLAAANIYTEREAVIALLEEGYEKSGQDSRGRDSLVSVYLERAEERASKGDYEGSLQDYDRLLELDGQNETVLESLTGSLKSYMDFLLGEENFDRVRELAEKYASALPDFDFAFYLDEIDRLELEKLRSQLELPFTADDVTLFGYKLTEDHFDEMIAFLGLSSSGDFNEEYERSRYADDGSYRIRAYDNQKRIFIDVETYVDPKIADMPDARFSVGISIFYQDNGVYSFRISDEGLTWLKDHYPGNFNLPLVSCMGSETENWCRSLPVEEIKGMGEYSQKATFENIGEVKESSWTMDEPVEVVFTERDYIQGCQKEFTYRRPDSRFSIGVEGDADTMITFMTYIWSSQ